MAVSLTVTTMLEDFGLFDKRQMVRYQIDWKKHFILTHNKDPEYVCLNIKKLGDLGEEERVELLVQVLQYLYD